MKKTVLMLICSVFMLGGLSGGAAAAVWTDPVTIGESLSGTGSYSWTHALPGGDFSVPPDTVNSASLAIVARRAVDSNDFVYHVDLELGSLLAGNGNNEATTTFDLGALLLSSDWVAGDLLHFRLDYSQGSGASNTLTLVSSLFTLDYIDNSNGSPAPVPEPSTIVLLASGLLGLLYVGRKRSRK